MGKAKTAGFYYLLIILFFFSSALNPVDRETATDCAFCDIPRREPQMLITTVALHYLVTAEQVKQAKRMTLGPRVLSFCTQKQKEDVRAVRQVDRVLVRHRSCYPGGSQEKRQER